MNSFARSAIKNTRTKAVSQNIALKSVCQKKQGYLLVQTLLMNIRK